MLGSRQTLGKKLIKKNVIPGNKVIQEVAPRMKTSLPPMKKTMGGASVAMAKGAMSVMDEKRKLPKWRKTAEGKMRY